MSSPFSQDRIVFTASNPQNSFGQSSSIGEKYGYLANEPSTFTVYPRPVTDRDWTESAKIIGFVILCILALFLHLFIGIWLIPRIANPLPSTQDWPVGLCPSKYKDMNEIKTILAPNGMNCTFATDVSSSKSSNFFVLPIENIDQAKIYSRDAKHVPELKPATTEKVKATPETRPFEARRLPTEPKEPVKEIVKKEPARIVQVEREPTTKEHLTTAKPIEQDLKHESFLRENIKVEDKPTTILENPQKDPLPNETIKEKQPPVKPFIKSEETSTTQAPPKKIRTTIEGARKLPQD